MIVLDTDVLSILEWSATNVAAQTLLDRLDKLGEEVTATVVSLEEQMRGWMASLAKKKSVKEQIEAYRRLRLQFQNLCKMKMLDFDERAATSFQNLKKRKLRIGTMDLKIGAIALSHDAAVVTGNTRDFELISDLSVKDWRKL